MPRKPNKIECAATTADGRACRAWAVRDTDPPLCSAHAGLNIGAGAPPRNQNRTVHGFYGRIFQNGELADLQRFAEDLSLEDEIGLVRVTLRRVMTRLGRYNLAQDELTNEELVKIASLVVAGCCGISGLFPAGRPTGWRGLLARHWMSWAASGVCPCDPRQRVPAEEGDRPRSRAPVDPMEQPTASCLRAVAQQPSAQQAAQWQEIRLCDTTDALLFKYDPQTNRIHIITGRSEAIIDLDDYRPRASGRTGKNRPGFWGQGGGRQPATWRLLGPGRKVRVAGGGTRQRAVEGILARLFWFGKGE